MLFMHPRKSKRRDAILAVQDLLRDADSRAVAMEDAWRGGAPRGGAPGAAADEDAPPRGETGPPAFAPPPLPPSGPAAPQSQLSAAAVLASPDGSGPGRRAAAQAAAAALAATPASQDAVALGRAPGATPQTAMTVAAADDATGTPRAPRPAPTPLAMRALSSASTPADGEGLAATGEPVGVPPFPSLAGAGSVRKQRKPAVLPPAVLQAVAAASAALPAGGAATQSMPPPPPPPAPARMARAVSAESAATSHTQATSELDTSAFSTVAPAAKRARAAPSAPRPTDEAAPAAPPAPRPVLPPPVPPARVVEVDDVPHATPPLSLFTQALASGDGLERSLAVDALHAVRSRLPKTLHSVAAAAAAANASMTAGAGPVPPTPATVLLVGAPAAFDLPAALDVPVTSVPATTRVPLRVLTQRYAALRDVINASSEASMEGRLLAAMKTGGGEEGDDDSGDEYDVEDDTSGGNPLAALGYRYTYGYGRTLGRSMLSSLSFGAGGPSAGMAAGASSNNSGSSSSSAVGAVGVGTSSGGGRGGAGSTAGSSSSGSSASGGSSSGSAATQSTGAAAFAIPPVAASPTAALGISPHMAAYADIAADASLRQVAADVAAAAAVAATAAVTTATGAAPGAPAAPVTEAAGTACVAPKPISPPRVAAADLAAALVSEAEGGAEGGSGGSTSARAVPAWAQFSPAAAVATAVVFLPLSVPVPSVELFIRPAMAAHQREAAAAGGVAALLADAPSQPGYRAGAPLRLRGRLYDVVAGDAVAKRARTLFEPLAHVLRVLVGALVARPVFMAMLVLSRPFPDPDAFPTASIFGGGGAEGAGAKRRRVEGSGEEGGSSEGGGLALEDERAMLGTTAQDLWSATLSSVLRHTTSFYTAVGVPHAIQSLSVETVAASPATLAQLSARGNDAHPSREYVVVCVTLARPGTSAPPTA